MSSQIFVDVDSNSATCCFTHLRKNVRSVYMEGMDSEPHEPSRLSRPSDTKPIMYLSTRKYKLYKIYWDETTTTTIIFIIFRRNATRVIRD